MPRAPVARRVLLSHQILGALPPQEGPDDAARSSKRVFASVLDNRPKIRAETHIFRGIEFHLREHLSKMRSGDCGVSARGIICKEMSARRRQE